MKPTIRTLTSLALVASTISFSSLAAVSDCKEAKGNLSVVNNGNRHNQRDDYTGRRQNR